MTRTIVGIAFALSFASGGVADASELALVGGDVHTVSGSTLRGATVLIRGDRIVRIGTDVAVPAAAEIIDCKGRQVTPGLVESDTAIGLVEIEQEPSTVNHDPKWRDATRAAFRAVDALDPRSPLVGVARRQGITSIASAPRGGLISGRSAWMDLVHESSPEIGRAVFADVAMRVHLGERGAAAAAGSRAMAFLQFREALDDARMFAANRSAFTRNALYRLSTSRLDLEALGPVVAGKLPVIVEVSRASDISATLELAREQRLRVILVGAEEGWLVADDIARANVPVIVDPLANLPARFESRNARADNATILAKAGVRVAIATRSNYNASNLRFALGNAVRAGLPRDSALRAATLEPAEIYGRKDYGRIERGAIANVVVWTGDPFEPGSHAEHVVVRGERQPLASRQTKLAERYLGQTTRR